MTQALLQDPPEDAPPRLPPALSESTVSEIAAWLVGHTLDQVERELIHHTLQNCGGDRVLAASVLGVSLPILKRKMTAYAVRGQALPEPAAPVVESKVQIPQADNDPEPAPTAAVVALKPEQPKRSDFRLWLGCALIAALTGLFALGLFGKKETAADFVLPERPRIDVSIVERPPPSQLRIAVPPWNGPMPPLPEPAATVVAAAPAHEAIVAFNSEQDTIMELAAPAPVVAVGSLLPAKGLLAGANIEEDTRMDPAAVSEVADSASEATGSVESEWSFVAPDDVPEPLARPAPAAPAKAAPVKRQVRPRAAPAQAAAPLPAATPAQPKQPVFPFINIFAPKNTPRTAGGTVAPGN